MIMRRRAFVHLIASVLVSPAFAAPAFAADGIQVSGPVVHDNLAIYFVHGAGGGGAVPLTLQEALAKGADRAIHLEDDKFVGLDALNTAKAIAAAIKDEKFDLIFTGLQSDDYGYAQTGVILAELLGWPHATIIMQIEKTGSGIRVKRELEAGYFQFVDMPTPAVLTIQSGINKLRYATLIGIKQAKNKPMRKIPLAEVQSVIGENQQKIEKLYVPQKTKKTETIEGTPAEIAKKLVDKLRNELRVL